MWQCCDLDAALEIQATSTQSPPQAHHSWATRWGSVPIQRPSRPPSTKSPARQRFLKEVFSKIRHLWMHSDREQDNSMPGKDILQLLFWSNSSGFHFPAPFEPYSVPLRLKDSLQLCSVEESSSAFKYSPPLPSTPQQSLWLLQRAVVPIAPWPLTQSSSLNMLPRKLPWHEQLEWLCEGKNIIILENKESCVWNLPVRNANIQWHQYRIQAVFPYLVWRLRRPGFPPLSATTYGQLLW